MGLLRAAARRTGAGGRPAKVYSASAQRIEVTLPPRRYEVLAGLLLELMSTLPPEIEPAALALAAGRAYGRGLAHAGEVDDGRARTACERALDWLISAGYALAVSAPAIVCGIDRGMLSALFGAADGDYEQTLSIVDGDASCRYEFTLW
jgi:predicted ArsR family transcriptional regulator